MEKYEANQGESKDKQLEAYQRYVGTERGEALPKLIIELTDEATAALEVRSRATGQSSTDIINNALVGYGFMATASGLGYEILLRDPSDGDVSRVWMFRGEDEAPEDQPPVGPQ